jgi:amidophosphoribosyltransferase
VRDVEPGEMLVIDDSGVRSVFPFQRKNRKMCLFEYVYFARPDSTLEGASVYAVRRALGSRLAIEHPVPDPGRGDTVVIPVPDSGVPAAVGFADEAKIPFEMGLIRSHYVGRTFIEPQESIRHFGVRLKLSPNRAAIQGKRVIVVDDSVVRGTTSHDRPMLRDAGAAELHVRISEPTDGVAATTASTPPTRGEPSRRATASTRSGTSQADSIGYLSLEGLVDAVRSVEAKSKSPRPGPTRRLLPRLLLGLYPKSPSPRRPRPPAPPRGWLDGTPPRKQDSYPMNLFERMPDRVSIYEVSPRDGLQNGAATISPRGQAPAARRARRVGAPPHIEIHELRLAEVGAPAGRGRARRRIAPLPR